MKQWHWGVMVAGYVSIRLTGCGGKHAEIKEDRLTVGRVQRGEVKVGMSAAQVAELLGSPNIVTTDDKRREVWIYDKVSTDRVDVEFYHAGLIILGANSSDHSVRSVNDLDDHHQIRRRKKVRDFAYNSTQFKPTVPVGAQRVVGGHRRCPGLAAGGERVCSAAGSTG